jgi:hypothetical protein
MLVSTFITGKYKRTREGRRKRLREALKERLTQIGWYKVSNKPDVYERKPNG